jgi:hypothetical protein
MTPPVLRPIDLPDHWTPDQALAVFQILELMRDQLWAAYGTQIQLALRQDQRNPDPPSPPSALDDPPF